MKPKRPSRREILSSCSEIRPDDGVDPRTFFRKSGRKPNNRKALQMCGEIARTVGAVLAWESGDEVLRSLAVDAVEPAPDSTRVLVTVHLQTPVENASVSQVLEHLDRSRGKLRTAVAAAIHRKRSAGVSIPRARTRGGVPMSELFAVVRRWLAGPLPSDVALAIDRLARTDDVRHVAVMPDVHLSHEVCTGTVVATRRLLYPHAVGNDIGCGMAAVRFHADASILADEQAAAKVLAGLYRTVPTIRHARGSLRDQLPDVLQSTALSDPRLEKLTSRDGRVEFATLGRGNHFIELQADDAGQLWLMIHSGSRAMGQAINAHHLATTRSSNTGLQCIDAESDFGMAYLSDLDWACLYAAESRREMMEAVIRLMANLFGIAVNRESAIYCNHNHVAKEEHFGEKLWVHRKGAISARDGELGIIPGSMGTVSYHVAGRGHDDALCSSSHGAGRCMSRAEAFKAIPAKEFCRQMKKVWFDHRLAGKLRDEAPTAYKDIHAVMSAQRELTRIVRRLRPLLSYKGV